MSLYMDIPTVSKSPVVERAAQQKRTLDVDPKRKPHLHTYLDPKTQAREPLKAICYHDQQADYPATPPLLSLGYALIADTC